MNARTTILRLALIAVFLPGFCYAPGVKAQQPGAANAEQEFLDAIKQGNSSRVGELLKQNPDLIKARTKEGNYARYAGDV